MKGLQELFELLDPSRAASLSGLFRGAAPLLVARAPGRLDVMGGFADYSGSLTLELPIAEAACVALQPHAEPTLELVSARGGADPAARRAVFRLDELERETRSYAEAREYFRREPSSAWTAYVAGCCVVLRLELGLELRSGASLLVASSVPEGKGVSSSAALEVATLGVLAGHLGSRIDPVRTALLCQRVENLVVGAPCGVMDQMTSSCGLEGQLLPLLCQPAELQPCLALPAGLALWGIDSGLRHEVSGADYGEVRVAAFMGYRWLAEQRGLRVSASERPGHVRIDDPEWQGYLARVPRGEFESRYRGFKARGERPPYPPVMIGLASAHNHRKGYSSETPVLIGNEQSARHVFSGGSDQPVLGLNRMGTGVMGAGLVATIDEAGQTARKKARRAVTGRNGSASAAAME